ncbi:MAG TPA: SH3 domain-containing protein [Terriglobales bacterium]|nr:SH3 domain-containing protein [Terriglobales bacterium]
MLALVCLFAGLPAMGRVHREHWGEGFSVDLNHPYAQILNIVHSVTEDGLLRGTSEYRGSSELDGATSAKESNAFPAWQGEGTVLYKIRPKTLAPDHFKETNDEGTITVRYVVQSLGPASTRLRIDAVFKEATGHHTHLSDGAVEDGEFEAIAAKVKDLEDAEEKRKEESQRAAQEAKLEAMQTELQQENSQLASLTAKESELQQQLQSKKGPTGVVRTESADLKASPYNQSRTLQLLAQGEAVTILQKNTHWYRVAAASGKTGWVYRPMLQAPAEGPQ